MGNDLSTASGGGRTVEAWSDARTRRVVHEQPIASILPPSHGDGRVPPPLLPSGEIRSAADDALITPSSWSAVTVSTCSTPQSVFATLEESLHAPHRAHGMSMRDESSATALPASAAPLQQPQKRTQYSMYARQMRRRGRDGGRLRLHQRNSGVDFLVANEFFSRSDSTVGSESDLGSQSASGSSAAGEDANNARRARHRCGMTPMEPISPHRPGRPLSRGLTRHRLFEHSLQHEMYEVDGAPVSAWSATAAAVAATLATSPPHAQSSSTGRAEKTASKAVSTVGSGLDGSSDLPPALTSSRNCSTGSHDSKPSLASGSKGGATPSPSSRPLSWRKRLLQPVSQNSSGAPTKVGAAKRSPSDDGDGALLSSQEEKKCSTRRKGLRPEGSLGWKYLPHASGSGAAAISISEETLVATGEVPITKESLRSIPKVELSGLDLSTCKVTHPDSCDTRAEAERLRTAGGTVGSNALTLANRERDAGVAGEYGSHVRAPTSPAQQRRTADEYDGGQRRVSSAAYPPRSLESPACQSTSTSSHHSGSSSSSTGSTRHPNPAACHPHRSRDADNNSAAETTLACLAEPRHRHRRLTRTSSGGGGHDLCDESCNDFFASAQQCGPYRMLYGTDGILGGSGCDSSDDDESDRNSESGSSTASMREAARMASGGGGAMVPSFGSFFDGSQSSSLRSETPSPGQPWIGDYADGRRAEVTAAAGMPALYDGRGTRKAARHHPNPGLHRCGASEAFENDAGVLHTQLQRLAHTLSRPTPPLPSPGANYPAAPAMPEEGSQGTRDSPLSALTTPASVVSGEAATSHQRFEAPAAIREALSATAHCHGAQSHIRAATEARSNSSGVFGSGSSGDSGAVSHPSATGPVGPSRASPAAEAVAPSLLPQPPKPQTPAAHTEARRFRRCDVEDRNTDLAEAEGAAAFSTTPKSFNSDAGRRHHPGNGGSSSSSGGGGGGGGALQASVSVLASVQGSGNALRPLRADSKDLILRPDRTTAATRHRSGRDDNAPGGSGSRQRRPRNRMHSSGARHSSFSFSSDSFLYGKVRGRLAKAAAAAVAANSSSIERRRRASGSGGGGGMQAHARHRVHSDTDSVALGASPSASPRKAENDGCHDCRHPSGSSGSHYQYHKHHGINTSSDRKREMRSRRHLCSGHGNGSEIGSLVAGLDDLLLGTDSRAASGNLTALYPRSVSSSSSSLAPSSRNSSANGGVGGSGSGVGSGSVRALCKRAAKARDLSASSSVDSESNGHLHSDWTAPPLLPPQQQQQRAAAGSAASASPMYRLPLVKTSSSTSGTVAVHGSANGAAAGGACGMKLPSFKLSKGIDMNSSPDASIDRPAKNGVCRLTSEYNTVACSPNLLHHQQQQQPQMTMTALHDLIGREHSSSSNRPSQPPRSPAALPAMQSVAMSQKASPGVGMTASVSVSMPMINGHEKWPRQPTIAPNMAGLPPNGSVGGAHLPRMPRQASFRCTSSRSDGDSDFVAVSLLDVNSRGDGGASASLLVGSARDSSTKRRRPTTQNFTPWSVDLSRFKALHEAQESPS
ncbi:hypothetical protein LSCM1_07761 [Leishmania martiniquensis]|uniref:Uncharacterized protein n=1 Tax=Leishmania martiniquensis TaxID=1580590 RepID=A0A836H951_9TRYP|nr:hypothetical protein LSCM1_07761 [Leishmania martiniquensis]